MNTETERYRAADTGLLYRGVSALIPLAILAIFFLNVHRHYFLSDDAFISFRYARNLAEGRGSLESGRWETLKLGERYLNFVTYLSEEEFSRRFGAVSRQVER